MTYALGYVGLVAGFLIGLHAWCSPGEPDEYLH